MGKLFHMQYSYYFKIAIGLKNAFIFKSRQKNTNLKYKDTVETAVPYFTYQVYKQ